MSGVGRLLAVDYGKVRVGLAVSDPDRKFAFPLTTYHRSTSDRDSAYFRELLREERIGEILVGLPVHMSGDEGEKAREARAFGTWLAGLCGLPVVYWDERFTTVEAEGFLQDAGLTKKQRKARRDRVAAQILLQSYLEAGCPGEQPVRRLDE